MSRFIFEMVTKWNLNQQEMREILILSYHHNFVFFFLIEYTFFL